MTDFRVRPDKKITNNVIYSVGGAFPANITHVEQSPVEPAPIITEVVSEPPVITELPPPKRSKRLNE